MPSVPKPKFKRQAKRFAKLRDPNYQGWVRGFPCLLATHGRHACLGPVQAAHVQSRGAGGPDHGNIVPLCLGAHHEQHSIGTKSFEARYHTNLKLAAEWLGRMYQDMQNLALADFTGPRML